MPDIPQLPFDRRSRQGGERVIRPRRILPDLTKPDIVCNPDPEVTFDLPTEKEIAEHREAMRYWDEEEAEFKRIKNSVPLGAARHVEPRSIHSPLHTPAWKRKLRP